MAVNKKPGYMSGSDAAYIEPKFVPDYQLLGRDDSGGIDYQPYAAQWGDYDFKQGAKAHLSASGGEVEPVEGDERAQTSRTQVYKARYPEDKPANSKKVPASSKSDAKD